MPRTKVSAARHPSRTYWNPLLGGFQCPGGVGQTSAPPDSQETTAAFPDGFVWIYDQQEYRPLRVRAHVAKDGQEVKVVDWETECPRCGVTFVVWTPLAFGGPRRRCDNCKSKTQPHVKTMRRQLRKLIAEAP